MTNQTTTELIDLIEKINLKTEQLVNHFFAKVPDVRDMSIGHKLALWPQEIRDKFTSELSPSELILFTSDWLIWARPKQIAPEGDWTYWLLLAGRGFGKTRSIAEWANKKAREMPESRGAIVAATAGDARDVLIEGFSGILACAPDDFKPHYEPSKRRLTWPNGTVATVFTADKPDRLRGPQFHWAVADELAAWRYPEAWDMLQFGLRLGENPQCAIATTPRPTPIIMELIEDETCHVTTGTTYENVDNLAPAFFNKVIKKYEGTRLGRQELYAQILTDVPGALWNRDLLDETRYLTFPEIYKTAVAIDPAATTGQTGIVVVGIAKIYNEETKKYEDQGFVLDDCTPEPGASPGMWANAAIAAYHKWEADVMVAEINHGGAMVGHTILTSEDSEGINFQTVRASQGKQARGEPVAMLFEQNRVHFIGFLGPLEDELCTWVPNETPESPNRLDAMVWGITHLMVKDIKTNKHKGKTAKPRVVSRQQMGL